MNRLIWIGSGIWIIVLALGVVLWWQYQTPADPNPEVIDISPNTNTVDNRPNLKSFEPIKPIDAYADKIPTDETFVLADLDRRIVTLYQNGQKMREAEILSKGANGSFWETPTGLYEIQYRNENHISSIGNVNMPYSMQYSGNFFIHGWPTHLDGSDVGPGFSGGCIRLDTPGAGSIFPYTKWGTKLLVIDPSTLQSDYQANLYESDYQLLNNLSAEGVIIANSNSGEVYYAKNQDQNFDLGSIANFLVAFAANENISYASEIPEYVKGPNGWVADGHKYNLATRYPTLLTETGDQDVISIVRYRGAKTFMDYLDQKTSAIGMVATAHELQSDNTIDSTARLIDWYHLARYLYHQKPFLLEASQDVRVNDPYTSYVTTVGNLDSAINYIEVGTPDNPESIVVILTNSIDINNDFKAIKQIFK